MTEITASATITTLRRLFSAYGLPEHLVTDNATAFMSKEFQTFMSRNGILHFTSAPRHPFTNGLAERGVCTLKEGLKKLSGMGLDVEDKLSLFLLQYCTTPTCVTGQSPADLFLKRHVRTRLDFIKPDITETVRQKQYKQKYYHDQKTVDRGFMVDEPVYLRDTTGKGPKWIAGVITQQTGPISFKVKGCDTDIIYRRHSDQLRPRMERAMTSPELEGFTDTTLEPVEAQDTEEPALTDTDLRRSQRTIKAPQRYEP